ncbi:hypothetical protein UMZ34_04340 [Halopseudomonas pachastrellae]|nr:hypothetical protein UMZ34_04340 [Halopseudomonas pachastrellae]
MQHELSRYILTVSVINILLGVVTGCVLFFMGVEDALLWGRNGRLAQLCPLRGAGHRHGRALPGRRGAVRPGAGGAAAGADLFLHQPGRGPVCHAHRAGPPTCVCTRWC